ncbi:hypothetical protein BLNAU_12038 [Blattamonas nauphoetae]|uniref:CCHC-type domain-containing protein n=1 Tax=Blattamonas nauphoetae TaxID=2049346 RepID=A0ABQ9XQG3_9EUKA|nr:hypothetical protein BLNAU_12038 [Blattamonas nauphoetae]
MSKSEVVAQVSSACICPSCDCKKEMTANDLFFDTTIVPPDISKMQQFQKFTLPSQTESSIPAPSSPSGVSLLSETHSDFSVTSHSFTTFNQSFSLSFSDLSGPMSLPVQHDIFANDIDEEAISFSSLHSQISQINSSYPLFCHLPTPSEILSPTHSLDSSNDPSTNCQSVSSSSSSCVVDNPPNSVELNAITPNENETFISQTPRVDSSLPLSNNTIVDRQTADGGEVKLAILHSAVTTSRPFVPQARKNPPPYLVTGSTLNTTPPSLSLPFKITLPGASAPSIPSLPATLSHSFDVQLPSNTGSSVSTLPRCFKCGQTGHIFRTCPLNTLTISGTTQFAVLHTEPVQPSPARQKDVCYKCGQLGHQAKDCVNDDTRVCFVCKQVGHISKDCPKSRRNRKKRRMAEGGSS